MEDCPKCRSNPHISKQEIQDYLDDAIRNWRNRKEEYNNEENKLIAMCYIDAFQSVRVSLLGELLPIEQTHDNIISCQHKRVKLDWFGEISWLECLDCGRRMDYDFY